MTDVETPPPSPGLNNPIEETRANLRLLGVFYIIMGLLALPILLAFSFHGLIFDQILEQVNNSSNPELADSIQKIATAAGFGLFLLVLLHVATGIYIGICFRRQKHHALCLVAAAFCCLSFPLGTILGIFSIIVLMKPEAKYLYGIAPSAEPT